MPMYSFCACTNIGARSWRHLSNCARGVTFLQLWHLWSRKNGYVVSSPYGVRKLSNRLICCSDLSSCKYCCTRLHHTYICGRNHTWCRSFCEEEMKIWEKNTTSLHVGILISSRFFVAQCCLSLDQTWSNSNSTSTLLRSTYKSWLSTLLTLDGAHPNLFQHNLPCLCPLSLKH